MTTRRVLASRIDFTALRRELELPTEFPPAAQREAEQAAAKRDATSQREAEQAAAKRDATSQRAASPPAAEQRDAEQQDAEREATRRDRTDLALVTIDPPGSMDLDQAVRIERRPGGYRVYYAIADVAAFVRPGGELDAEVWRRTQTVYFPDSRVPLHPPVLSEGAASLLPDQDRPAVLWTIDLDADGEPSQVWLERALVRSRARYDYAGVQEAVDAGRPPEPIELLAEVGKLRLAHAVQRGAIELGTPEQEVTPDAGGWRLTVRAALPVELYNAQISLVTGICAARIMLAGRVGVLRTLPPARPADVERVRAGAHGLGIDWPDGASPSEVVAAADPGSARGAAFLDLAATLLRGAGYTSFDGTVPEQPGHAGVASVYAHVTAPLRRLVDRYATEVCLALHHSAEIPPWARDGLGRLPEAMAAGDRLASTAERAVIDLTEAVLLADRVGQTFDAAVIDADVNEGGNGQRVGTVALDDPPVRARCHGTDLPVGERIRVRLVEADPVRRKVLFERATDA